MNELPLRDIHLPSAVSAWPPAIGWWLLALFILLAIAAGAIFLRYRKNKTPKPAYKKIALKNISGLQKKYKNQGASIELLRSISALLRRIALSYLPRESIASLTGEQWIEQLNHLSKEPVFNKDIGELLINAPYQKKANYDADELLKQCKQWIEKLPNNTNINTMAKGDTT